MLFKNILLFCGLTKQRKTKLMLNLKLSLFIVVIFISGCVVIPTYKARISLNPTSQNHQEVQINNVLLIGTGSVASKVFLENLSAEMMRSFSSKGIESEFSYIGKIPPTTALKLDSLKQDKYDSYLVFKSANASYLDMTKVKFIAISPAAMATRYGNQYAETFTVTLYNGKDKQQIIWQGELDVDFDIANDSRYKQISKLIFNEFVKSRILLN